MPPRPTVLRLVAVPALIAVAVTLVRLAGERGHWSERWFSTATGGIVPAGMSWLVGITWLALPFGAWFAWRLLQAGEGPPNAPHALGHAIFGFALVYGLLYSGVFRRLPIHFPRVLIVGWLLMVVAALLQWPTWPRLARTLLVYGLLSRLPVALVMFLAMRGNWGTHYDYVGMGGPFVMPFWPRFLWLAFFPQLVLWVAFTVLAGSLAGSLVAVARGRPRVSAATDRVA
jgi:hypothetical protein